MWEVLSSKIDLSASRLKPYKGFIFLCGGPTDVRATYPISVRDAIYRELVKDRDIDGRIRVAEHYKDWSSEAVYPDLVSFERHLAELSSVIVLVLESAGSIAELGLFSVIEEFKKKLLIFIETEHYQSESFIKLGPIDYLEKIYDNFAQCHRWLTGSGSAAVLDKAVAVELQPELAEAVRSRASRPLPETRFQPSEWLHGALLACDLLNICSALTIRELRQLMVSVGCERSESEIKQLLFLLTRMGFLTMEPKGDQRFYVSTDAREFIRFGLRDTSFDLMRFRSNLLETFQLKDKKRFRVIQEVRKRYAK